MSSLRFQQFMQFFLHLISLSAAIAVDAYGSRSVQRDLETRDVPPCPKCPVSDQNWLSVVYKQPVSYQVEPQSAVTGNGWLPRACSMHGYTCIVTAPDIHFRAGGFPGYPQVGKWTRPNGEQIFVSKYWEQTIQFIGTEATFNIYPAHCTIYILSKGENTQVTHKPKLKVVMMTESHAGKSMPQAFLPGPAYYDNQAPNTAVMIALQLKTLPRDHVI
ncbi:uncharacterized protein MYCFIDRAFT_77725 [Pseudocercospora fijiensis CIRAD86]|uniref:Uncharacterized protein n=1 Tax=Pseudocercospora fijiensis (strain CIRAD86) TaxID=383855 RepID=M2YW61_PSEFD|nr:uncharacterized protein MYCFIDRAFT_77725 [Pseudocercospora fijiensis CIRAD86]EME81960.1 hypothetical protein MYCFIDRAFT_77725 [Pseudocercospora fijiensis CIRAD86]